MTDRIDAAQKELDEYLRGFTRSRETPTLERIARQIEELQTAYYAIGRVLAAMNEPQR